MKSWLVLSTVIGMLNLTGYAQIDVQEAAQSVIANVLRVSTPEQPAELHEQLTPSEQRAVGRYFETPTLDEVYPGIGDARRTHR